MTFASVLAACGNRSAGAGAEPPTLREQPVLQPEHDEATQPQPEPAPTSRFPSPSACQIDTDCTVVVTAPSSDNLCCDTTVTAEPIAAAYLAAVARWRASACAGVTCPPNELPGAQLVPCGYDARCVSGVCTNACGPLVRPSRPDVIAPPP